MSTKPLSVSSAVATWHCDEAPRWSPPEAAVHAALTLQFAADMHKLLECAWVIAFSADRGSLQPIGAFGEHPDPALASLTAGEFLAGSPEKTWSMATCTVDSPLSAAAPLMVHGRVAGVVALGPKRGGSDYTPSDLDLLRDASVQIGGILENQRMSWHLAAGIMEAQRTRQELNAAREVQNRLFPVQFPAVKNVDYYGECEPCGGVGGDFFDFIALPGNGLAMAMGQVSGHNVPAAIVLAALQAALRSMVVATGAKLSTVVAELNRLVCLLCPDNMYATLFLARLEPAKGLLTYVNAGREPALLVREGASRIHRLGIGGTVLGLTRQSAYEQAAIPLDGGEMLVASTDGLGAGEDLVKGYMRMNPRIGARDLVLEILHGAAEAFDDRTAIAAHVHHGEQKTPLFAVASREQERIHQIVAA